MITHGTQEGRTKLGRFGKPVGQVLVLLIAVSLLTYAFFRIHAFVSSRSAKRIMVAFPEKWRPGEYRKCKTVYKDSLTGLPLLDCDQQPSDTPRSRMFVMEVRFSGKELTFDQQPWTCQRKEESLACKN
jgi:hypothetical protein